MPLSVANCKQLINQNFLSNGLDFFCWILLYYLYSENHWVPMLSYFVFRKNILKSCIRILFGTREDAPRTIMLLKNCPTPIKPDFNIYLNKASWLLTYFQPARRLYIAEPARIHKSGSWILYPLAPFCSIRIQR